MKTGGIYAFDSKVEGVSAFDFKVDSGKVEGRRKKVAAITRIGLVEDWHRTKRKAA